MSSIRASYAAIVAASALVLAACGDATTAAPTANVASPKRPSLNVTIGTPPTTRLALEGQYWVCKASNAGAPQETFNFTYSAAKPVGSTQPDLLPGSFSIKNGECALIYSINTAISVKPYAVTVTEGAMPNADWAFTSAAVSTIAPYNVIFLGTPVYNGQTITGTSFFHDQGAILTVTNTYTAPPPPPPATGQIGDFVWDDVNGNGVQDSGEPGLGGVTVNLSGAASATTTTNASGAYLFSGLSAGSYSVTVDGSTLPAGYIATSVGQGTTATDNNGSPASVVLATSSTQDLSVDFGFTKARGQIGDFVFSDLNGNGIQDSGEPGIAGVTVTLGGASSATTTTNASGAYVFTGLLAGTYTVTVGTPSGTSPSPSAQGGDPTKDSNGSPASVTLASNNSSDVSIDFGFVPDPTGQIGDYVWYDVNGNGIQDSGEPGIAGVIVKLSGTSSATTTTTASGAYLFTGLKAGSYSVAVDATTLPAGFIAAPTGQGTSATDNNGSPATVTLASGTAQDFSVDFGYTKGVGVIGDFVWNDLNGNGVQDSGEPGLAGVTVTLGGAASATTTTNASGNYFFSNLSGGSYTVSVGTPAGFSASPSSQGGDPLLDSNGSPASVTLAGNASSNLSIDFGFVPNPTGQIGDYVWYDVNGNGVQDGTEPGIANVTVKLSGTSSATTTTNASGAYLFTGLKAGSYLVTVDATTLAAGFVATATGQGTAATDNNGSPASVTLASSTSIDNSVDFGYTKGVGVIGDFVWNDLNGNGVQDSGEPGLAGVTVTLGGAASATTTTNASGNYFFSNLSGGSYTVSVGTPAGFSASPSSQGGDPLLDSNGSPASVTLAGNASSNLSIDFGFVPNPTGQIGDYVWYDVNGNGVQDGSEPGIANVTVKLSGTSSATVITNASGAYLFTGLKAGSYSVTVDATTLPAGFVATAIGQGTAATDNNGSPASVTLASSTSIDNSVDFGYTKGVGTIGDFVWNDLNGNGVQDTGEPGITGLTVTLGGAASATTTTDASGNYYFGNLSAGSYTVTVGTPAGFSASPSAQGGDPLKDSNGSSASVTLVGNSSSDLSVDFGFVPNPTGQIGNFVWDDVNGNGIQDSGEPGIAGVTVTLAGAVSASTTTNASGAYFFTGLKAGSYTVTVTAASLPSGFVPTLTGQGTAATDNNGSPASVTLATSSSQDLTVDFGYTTGRGEIGNFVWNDLNGNGIQDLGEPGLSGVTVTLAGAKSATTTTNANGAYLFSGLLAGNYTVSVGTVTGFNATTANLGGDPAKDSNTNPSNVTLAANNSTNYTIDYGFIAIPKPGPSCTLTQGYWKNHQELWDKNGERIVWTGQTFFKSGKTYAEIMATSVTGGNSYMQLAHQYIAAKLNVNGGSDPVINAAIAQAEALLNGHTQGSSFIKDAAWTSLATTLDNYNNGVTGPGHCN